MNGDVLLVLFEYTYVDFVSQMWCGLHVQAMHFQFQTSQKLPNHRFLFTLQVIMATNRIDILDSALLRPGRIDRKIEFPPPNEEARLDILKIHSRKMNLTRGINLRKIAETMPGSSG